MHPSERESVQTHSRATRHQTTNSGPAFRQRTISKAAALLWAIAFAVFVPTAADAQSWLKSLEEAGKRLLDHAVDKITQPSEGQTDPQTAPTPQLPSESKPSYPRDQVREVQRLLTDLGYQPGAVDGSYVPATTSAIRAYQSDQGLPQTGVPSSELVAHLKGTQNAHQRAAATGQAPARSAPKQQTSQPGGGMIAPAPEGAPVTAPGNQSPDTGIGRSTRAAGPAGTAPGVPTSSSGGFEIDVLAPEGISIGMSFSEAKAALTARGYTNSRGDRGRPMPCDFVRQRSSGTPFTTVNLVTRTKLDPYQSDCSDGEVVRVIRIGYDVFGDKDPSLLGLVKIAESRLGSSADCGRRNAEALGCRWNSPPNAPLVAQVILDGHVLRPARKFQARLTLQLLAKGDLKAQGPAPAALSPADSQASRSADSQSADMGPTERQVESSNRRTEPAQKSAVASQKGPFEIEGTQLGMTTAQVNAALRAKGFVPSDGGRGAQFVNERGKPHQPGSTAILVSYLPGSKNGPPEQAQSLISRFTHFTHSSRSSSDWQKVNEQIYQKLVAKYGEPDICTGQKSSSHNCKWSSQFDGWLATLEWQGSVSWATIVLKASSVDRSRFSGLASTTVASSSPPVPSPSASQSAETPGRADGASSTIGFDVLAPYDFSIGMSYSEVEASVKTMGFKGGDCVWYRSEGTKQVKVSFQSSGQRGTNFCGEGGLVKLIVVESSDSRGWAASAESIVASMNKQIGTAGKCNKPAKMTECRWESPPKPPLVREISVQLGQGTVYYRMRGAENLQSRVNLPAKPAARDEAQHWWTQELAKMDAAAQTVKFTGSSKFEQLPPQEKQRLSGEATTVYEFCRKKDTFNSLHDCRCVAGKFIDARVANEQGDRTAGSGQPLRRQQKWAPEYEKYQTGRRDSTTELITIADRVADQCPNKPGAADYGYKNCTNLYRVRLTKPDDLETFCTCYADTFASIYMNNPQSQVSTITGAGSGALLECTNKGLPSPMRR